MPFVLRQNPISKPKLTLGQLKYWIHFSRISLLTDSLTAALNGLIRQNSWYTHEVVVTNPDPTCRSRPYFLTCFGGDREAE
jgi:hypothetical protein